MCSPGNGNMEKVMLAKIIFTLEAENNKSGALEKIIRFDWLH